MRTAFRARENHAARRRARLRAKRAKSFLRCRALATGGAYRQDNVVPGLSSRFSAADPSGLSKTQRADASKAMNFSVNSAVVSGREAVAE